MRSIFESRWADKNNTPWYVGWWYVLDVCASPPIRRVHDLQVARCSYSLTQIPWTKTLRCQKKIKTCASSMACAFCVSNYTVTQKIPTHFSRSMSRSWFQPGITQLQPGNKYRLKNWTKLTFFHIISMYLVDKKIEKLIKTDSKVKRRLKIVFKIFFIAWLLD